MRSPFPGVDPYLESQGYWPDFHQSFMTYWRDALADRLPDNYEARLEERVQLMELSAKEETELRRPDLTVAQRRPSRAASAESGGTLTLEPVTIPLPIMEEVRETRIQILHRPGRTLVGVLELLSPGNKTGSGYSAYLAKRNDVIGQQVHLVELDLLLGGQRLPMRRPLPPGDYYAFVSRSDRRPESDVYTWKVRQPLPTLPIPLKAPDEDVLLDLDAIFIITYERGRYARSIDYDAPLGLSLSPEDRLWAETLAKSWKGPNGQEPTRP
jgi:hypothetical protein